MLYKRLSECNKMPSLLSIVPGYCDAYIPRSESGSLPKPLTSLFNEELIDASYSQLVDKSEETLRSIAISTEQAKSLELTRGQSLELTRGQSHSKLSVQGHVSLPQNLKCSAYRCSTSITITNQANLIPRKFQVQDTKYLLGIR